MQIFIGNNVDSTLKANSKVEQILQFVKDPYKKDEILIEILKKYSNEEKTNKIIVFCLKKREVARIETVLWNNGFYVGSLHGDKEQIERTKTLNSFKEGEISVLVATDVAARGLDIPNVEYVINYSMPDTIENYVHRIGRTGRAGLSGISHSLFTPLDYKMAKDVTKLMQTGNFKVPEEILDMTTLKKTES